MPRRTSAGMTVYPRRVRFLDPGTKSVISPDELSSPASSQIPSPTFSASTASSLTPPPTPESLFTTAPPPASKFPIYTTSSLTVPPTPRSLFTTTPLPASEPPIYTPPSLIAPLTTQSMFVTTPPPAPKSRICPAIAHLEINRHFCVDLAFPPSSSLSALNSPYIYNDYSPASSSSLEITKDALFVPATCPASTSITLTTEFLPWSITITNKPSFVSVYDVLQGLYLSLQFQVTGTEWECTSQAFRLAVCESFYVRVGQVVGSEEREKEKKVGVRRIDYLVGHTRFEGISGKDDYFKLHLGFRGPQG